MLIYNIVQGRSRTTGRVGDVPQGAGTGFIIDPAGVIVTNDHVVRGAQRLQVTLPDGRKFEDAQLLGSDPQTQGECGAPEAAPGEKSLNAIRVSFGAGTPDEHVERFVVGDVLLRLAGGEIGKREA